MNNEEMLEQQMIDDINENCVEEIVEIETMDELDDLEVQDTFNEDDIEDLNDEEGVVENVIYNTNEITEEGE